MKNTMILVTVCLGLLMLGACAPETQTDSSGDSITGIVWKW